MIFAKRILRLSISRVNSLPLPLPNSTSTLLCHRHVCDGSVNRRLQFENLRYYGTDPSKPAAKDEIAPAINADQYEQMLRNSREQRIHERSTVQFIINAMQTLGNRYLMDVNSSDLGLTYSPDYMYNWDKKISCYRHWLAVFEVSKAPLVTELKEKLQNSGITYEDFCQSIVESYFTLKSCHKPVEPGTYVKPEDVMDTIIRLKFTYKKYECLKILLGLNKIHGMKI